MLIYRYLLNFISVSSPVGATKIKRPSKVFFLLKFNTRHSNPLGSTQNEVLKGRGKTERRATVQTDVRTSEFCECFDDESRRGYQQAPHIVVFFYVCNNI